MTDSRSHLGFDALRLEGGILPAEFPQKIVGLEVSGQEVSDYLLPKGISIKEEIGRTWRIAGAGWSEFQEVRQRTDIDVAKICVEKWLMALLRDVLGYTDLKTANTMHAGERDFPISHRALGSAVPVMLTSGHKLDRDHPLFGVGGRRRSPHTLIQEYLNAEKSCLWGIVSNGLRIRLIRDNPSLTRPAFIEIDLERMFEEQLYGDFALFWLTFHASRARPADDNPETCFLETWRNEGHEIGERALASLRHGVTVALKELGNGFLHNGGNCHLRTEIKKGNLTRHEYFQELLRLVYRFLFLITAEERDLLHSPDAEDHARNLYVQGYGMKRLRDRASRRRHYTAHDDLWSGIQITFRALATGENALGLPALGGLFGSDQCPNLDEASIQNAYLLRAIHALCFFRTGTTLARVNYRDMDSEELGGVYESLLELHVRIDTDVTPWNFGFLGENENDKIKGSERKLSGSYYTPKSLVNKLIVSVLDPVIKDTKAKNPQRPREALLNLKIVDPACGSGHFLLAAARRLAEEVAQLDAADPASDGDVRRHALREVVRQCIFGVDRNPLAVELCRTALWIETVEPGRPLSFLDPHIRCGDSLVGVFDPESMNKGIPGRAYACLSGDEKRAANDLKKRNKLAGQGNLFDQNEMEPVTVASTTLSTMPDDTIEQIEAMRAAWIDARHDGKRQEQEFRADLYVGAFFAPKTLENLDQVPLTGDLERIGKQPPRSGLERAVRHLAEGHGFFHWHLEFPDIMQEGGFDVVVGNPPWERIKLQEKEFFAGPVPEIAAASNKSEREKLIKKLENAPEGSPDHILFDAFVAEKRRREATSGFVRVSGDEGGRFPLTGKGDVNTYALFAELFKRLARGRAGMIVPTGIATDATTAPFFSALVDGRRLVSLHDFENRERLFPIHRSFKFCLLTLAHDVERPQFAFFLTSPDQTSEPERSFSLSPEELRRVNPNTRTAPVFRSQADAALTAKIYAHAPVLVDETKGPEGNPWNISFMSMFHMSNDSGLFRTAAALEDGGFLRRGADWIRPDRHSAGQEAESVRYVPLYEAKMINILDHRWASYDEGTGGFTEVSDKNNLDVEPTPRYWVPHEEVEARLDSRGWRKEWLLGWRGVTNATNERTMISSVIPRVAVGNSMPLIFLNQKNILSLCFIANMSSIPFDFACRQKIGGSNINYFVLSQFPVLRTNFYNFQKVQFITSRMIELIYTSQAMAPYASDMGHQGPPFAWDNQRRARLRAELDAFFARAYGLDRDELRYILDPASVKGAGYPSETFRVLRENEIRKYGGYRTIRLVLEAWDKMENRREFIRLDF